MTTLFYGDDIDNDMNTTITQVCNYNNTHVL